MSQTSALGHVCQLGSGKSKSRVSHDRILSALKEHEGNVTEAAREIGLHPSTLERRVRRNEDLRRACFEARVRARARPGNEAAVQYVLEVAGIAPRPSAESLELLGLAWPCTPPELTAAYRERSRRHHPDRGGDTDMMTKINRAREDVSAALGRRSAQATTDIDRKEARHVSPR